MFTAPQVLNNTHCTGQGLTSFYECLVSPGSRQGQTTFPDSSWLSMYQVCLD